jgi:hypothetical protein
MDLVDVSTLVPERRKLGVASGYWGRGAALRRRADALRELLLHVEAEATAAESMARFLDLTREGIDGDRD